ncbi:MAG: hypothetical protein Q8P17_01695 [bacterium]|nr:hypothetical protein [bacterium]
MRILSLSNTCSITGEFAMTTIYTCTEPKDAWSLVSHFLGNKLLVIGMSNDEAAISRIRSELIGSLYMLVRNMNVHGHVDDASKIQQILDMVTDQDVTKAEVCEAIHNKNHELNAGKREFDTTMANLRAKGAFRS